MSREDVRRIGNATMKAAQDEFAGKQYAVVVVVRELPDGEMNVASNVVADRPNLLRILTEAASAVRNQGVVI